MITPEDEKAYRRWLSGTMTLLEAFAMYREEIEAKMRLDSNE